MALRVTRRRWTRSKTALLLIPIALLLLWLLANGGSALVIERDVGAPDAVVVLASHEWERLPAAAALARRFPASVVLLTVPAVVTKWNCHLCSERAPWLQALGVESQRIVELPLRVRNTRGEAVAAREFARTRGLRSLVVVTSPYHTRRALGVFRNVMAGENVLIGVVPATSTSPAMPKRWWRRPYDRAYVTYEWAALLWYAVRLELTF